MIENENNKGNMDWFEDGVQLQGVMSFNIVSGLPLVRSFLVSTLGYSRSLSGGYHIIMSVFCIIFTRCSMLLIEYLWFIVMNLIFLV